MPVASGRGALQHCIMRWQGALVGVKANYAMQEMKDMLLLDGPLLCRIEGKYS